MWSRIGRKTALNDLKTIVSTKEESSGIRALATKLLLDKNPDSAIDTIQICLRAENHPRLINVFLRILAVRGNLSSYELLQDLMSEKQWPGSCRNQVMFSLRMLRYRLGLLSAASLESSPRLETSSNWELAPWRMKPASGNLLHRALRFATKMAPTLPLERNFAVEFPCGSRKLCMMIREELNHIRPESTLYQQSSLCGILVSEEEDHLRVFGWLVSKPGKNGQLILDVYHVQGTHLYHGKGDLIDEAMHCDIYTVKDAPVPAAAMSFAFRTNQLMSHNRLMRASGPTHPSFDYAKSA